MLTPKPTYLKTNRLSSVVKRSQDHQSESPDGQQILTGHKSAEGEDCQLSQALERMSFLLSPCNKSAFEDLYNEIKNKKESFQFIDFYTGEYLVSHVKTKHFA